MEIVLWLLLTVSAFLTGWFLVRYLTVHPIRMSLMLFSTLLFGVTTLVLLVTRFPVGQLGITIPVVLVLFVAGYLIRTRVFLNTPDMRNCPPLIREPGDSGKGHTAVIYLTHGEPETYDPIGWLNQFREFDKHDIPFIPWFARPLFAYKLRNGYLRIGKSNHVFIHERMLKALEQEYRKESDTTTRFYLSFLDASPTVRAATVQALNDGASRIIVSTVFLTVSNHTAEGHKHVKSLDIEEKYGIPVHFTDPLHDSEILKHMFLERANTHCCDIDNCKVGILLVGHGQPDEWDKEWPTETEQELSFRNGVIELLVANGYNRENLSLAWMEFKKPAPALKVEEFVGNGCERILYFSAAISAEAMHSQYDVPRLVHKAKIPPHIQLVNMGAWNDDAIVIRAIKEKIDMLRE